MPTEKPRDDSPNQSRKEPCIANEITTEIRAAAGRRGAHRVSPSPERLRSSKAFGAETTTCAGAREDSNKAWRCGRRRRDKRRRLWGQNGWGGGDRVTEHRRGSFTRRRGPDTHTSTRRRKTHTQTDVSGVRTTSGEPRLDVGRSACLLMYACVCVCLCGAFERVYWCSTECVERSARAWNGTCLVSPHTIKHTPQQLNRANCTTAAPQAAARKR